MRKLEIADPEVMRIAIRQEIARSDESRYDHRLDGLLLSEHLRVRYGVRLGVRQCQRLFGQMGFRLRKPRPQVAQSDPVKVASVKKTPPSGATRRRRTVESG